MTGMFHFLLVIIKSLILALLYTAILSAVLVLILKARKRYVSFKWRKLTGVYSIVTALLIIFSFTYYGNHGLGDNSRIPLGYGETIYQSDESVYFVPKGKSEQIKVQTFLVRGDNLVMSVDLGYRVYNLKTKAFINFSDEPMYNMLAVAKDLPLSRHLKDFRSQYDDYWSGWRFWLLP